MVVEDWTPLAEGEAYVGYGSLGDDGRHGEIGTMTISMESSLVTPDASGGSSGIFGSR